MKKKSVKLYTDNVIESFYDAIRNNNLHKLHIPHSDVFYVRKAVEARYGRSFSLKEVEEAMIAEGWSGN
jgi:ribosomal protein L13E